MPQRSWSGFPRCSAKKPQSRVGKAALLWAFEVWRHDSLGPAVLESADLHVPAVRLGSGEKGRFSQTWTEAGRSRCYLAEAHTRCVDCEPRRGSSCRSGRLASASNALQEWVRFLSDAGVVDGLLVTPTNAPEGPIWGSELPYRLRGTKDRLWTKLVDNCGFTSGTTRTQNTGGAAMPSSCRADGRSRAV